MLSISNLSILDLRRVFMTQVLAELSLLVRRSSQMGNIEMPLGPICDKNVAIRPMGISDLVNLHVSWKDVYDHRIVQRNYARAQLFSSDKLTVRRIHRKEVAFHANKRPLVAFHRAHEMAPGVVRKKLTMNNVNVFACVKDHEFVPRRFSLAWSKVGHRRSKRWRSPLFSGPCLEEF